MSAREVGDALRIDATRLLSDVIHHASQTQRQLLTATVSTVDDVAAVLNDVRRVRDSCDAVDDVVRRALREMP